MNQQFVIILYQITRQLINMKKHIFELPNIIMDYLHEVVITPNTYARGHKKETNVYIKVQEFF